MCLCVCLCVCLRSVHAIKGKWLQLLTPKSVEIESVARAHGRPPVAPATGVHLTLRLTGQGQD